MAAPHFALAAPHFADRVPDESTPAKVEFRAVPVAAYLAMQEWNDAIVRECELIAALGPGRSDLPPPLVDLAARLNGRFAPDREGFRDVVEAARGRGVGLVDLHGAWHQPTEPSVAAAEAFLALMEDLDGYCGTNVLLTEPPEPVVIRLRRWFVTEMKAQLLDGAPAVAFDSTTGGDN